MSPRLHGAAPVDGPLFECAVCDGPTQTFRIDDDETILVVLVACDICGLVWGLDQAWSACFGADAKLIRAEVQRRLDRCEDPVGKPLTKDFAMPFAGFLYSFRPRGADVRSDGRLTWMALLGS